MDRSPGDRLVEPQTTPAAELFDVFGVGHLLPDCAYHNFPDDIIGHVSVDGVVLRQHKGPGAPAGSVVPAGAVLWIFDEGPPWPAMWEFLVRFVIRL